MISVITQEVLEFKGKNIISNVSDVLSLHYNQTGKGKLKEFTFENCANDWLELLKR